jgi:hypothetical protein
MSELIVGLLGAGTAWTIKDVIEAVTASKSKSGLKSSLRRTAAAIFGVLTGYSFGYWVASHADLDPEESTTITPFLLEKEHWIKIKRLMWLQTYYLFARRDPNIIVNSGQPSPGFESIIRSFAAASNNIANLSYNLQNKDFAALDQLIRYRKKYDFFGGDWLFSNFQSLPLGDQKTCRELYHSIVVNAQKNYDMADAHDIFDYLSQQYESSRPRPRLDQFLKKIDEDIKKDNKRK